MTIWTRRGASQSLHERLSQVLVYWIRCISAGQYAEWRPLPRLNVQLPNLPDVCQSQTKVITIDHVLLREKQDWGKWGTWREKNVNHITLHLWLDQGSKWKCDSHKSITAGVTVILFYRQLSKLRRPRRLYEFSSRVQSKSSHLVSNSSVLSAFGDHNSCRTRDPTHLPLFELLVSSLDLLFPVAGPQSPSSRPTGYYGYFQWFYSQL